MLPPLIVQDLLTLAFEFSAPVNLSSPCHCINLVGLNQVGFPPLAFTSDRLSLVSNEGVERIGYFLERLRSVFKEITIGKSDGPNHSLVGDWCRGHVHYRAMATDRSNT